MPTHFSSRVDVGAPEMGNDPSRIQLSQSYHPSFVVLSVLIAIVGSASTIELLLRRTGNRGAWNIGLLIGAGVSFGAVSTFAMHYIGNNSIILLLPPSQVAIHGNLRIKLAYSPGYTFLSLVVSVVSMCTAFAVNGLDVEGFLSEWKQRQRTKRKRQAASVPQLTVTEPAPTVGKEQKETGLTKDEKISQSAPRTPTSQLSHSPLSPSPVPPPSVVASPSHTLVEPPSPTKPAISRTDSLAITIDSNHFTTEHDTSFPKRSSGQTRNPYSSYLSATPIPLSGRRMSFEEFANSEMDGGMLNHIPLQDVVPVLSNFHPRQPIGETPSESSEIENAPNVEPVGRDKSDTVNEESAEGECHVPVNSTQPSWSEKQASRNKHISDDHASETSDPGHTLDQDQTHELEKKEQIDHGYHPSVWGTQMDLSKRSRSSIGGSTTDSMTDANSGRNGRNKIVNWWIRELGLRDVTRFEVWKVIIAGTICGLGVAGMHYLGQRSINTIPHVAYSPLLVVVSVLIACVAVTVGLWVLFLVLRPKLKHSLLKRLATSCILGGATSLMHWTAVLGTSYAVDANLVDIPLNALHGATRRLISGLVGGLAIVACLVTVASVSLAHHRMIAHRTRRRGVVLAAAIFDEKGHVLVTPDGVLPLYSLGNLDQLQSVHQHSNGHRRSSWRSHVSNRFSGTRFDEESLESSSVQDFDLTNSHPAFVASLRSSWSWKQPGSYPSSSSSNNAANSKASGRRTFSTSKETENDDLPSGRSTSSEESRDSTSFVSAFPPNISRSFGSVSPTSQKPLKASANRFLSKFTEAAAALAVELTGSARNARMLGVLYDRIFTTGFVSFTPEMSGPLEMANTVSRGQLLLLGGRCESHTDRALYNKRGYTFVEPSAMCRVMSTVLSVPLADMLPFFHSLEVFTRPKPVVPKARGRIYVGALAVQPLPFEGLKILLGEADRTDIPMKEFGRTLADGSIVSSFPQSSSQKANKRSHLASSINELGEAIARLDGSPLERMLREASSSFNTSEPDQLQIVLIDSILSLLRRLSQDVLKILIKSFILCPSIITLSPPSSSAAAAGDPSFQTQGQDPSYLVVFRAILPPTIDVTCVGGSFTWEPFRLFRAKNECVLQEARLTAGGDADPIETGTVDPRLGVQASSRRPLKIQWGEVRSSQGSISVVDANGTIGGNSDRTQTSLPPGSMFSQSFSLCPSASATTTTPVTIYRPPNILVQSPTRDSTERDEGESGDDLAGGGKKAKEGEVRAYSDTWLSQLLLVRGMNV